MNLSHYSTPPDDPKKEERMRVFFFFFSKVEKLCLTLKTNRRGNETEAGAEVSALRRVSGRVWGGFVMKGRSSVRLN